jgi:formate hydrogenlyase subunit 3/multisubunit Na+/H+ antiporter MnhD subunit
VLALVSLALALVLLESAGSRESGFGFAAIRAQPPEGWRAAAVLVLTMVGAGGVSAIPAGRGGAPGPLAAAVAGAASLLPLYVAVRLLPDLARGAEAAWWAAPLLIFGAAWGVLGAWRANLAADLAAIPAAWCMASSGLCAIGLGVAVASRAADLPLLGATALGAALLHALVQALGTALLMLCAASVEQGSGSRALARLGGLIHPMPATAGCAIVGSLALALLPPGPGFASAWLLFRALFAAPRTLAGAAPQIVLALAATAMAVAIALGAAAGVRLIGVAFLGRPRTPRSAAAEEAAAPARQAVLGLAVLLGLVGLLPGTILSLAAPALAALTGADLADRAGWLVLTADADSAAYAPLLVLAALVVLAAVPLARRRWGARGHRRSTAWDGGFAAPPPWFPFGDPATQYGAEPFVAPFRSAAALLDCARRIHAAWGWLAVRAAGAAAPKMGPAALTAIGAALLALLVFLAI